MLGLLFCLKQTKWKHLFLDRLYSHRKMISCVGCLVMVKGRLMLSPAGMFQSAFPPSNIATIIIYGIQTNKTILPLSTPPPPPPLFLSLSFCLSSSVATIRSVTVMWLSYRRQPSPVIWAYNQLFFIKDESTAVYLENNETKKNLVSLASLHQPVCAWRKGSLLKTGLAPNQHYTQLPSIQAPGDLPSSARHRK